MAIQWPRNGKWKNESERTNLLAIPPTIRDVMVEYVLNGPD